MGFENILGGEGDWTCVKEVLGWTLNTEAGMVTLPEQKIQELLTLVDISVTQLRMGRNDIKGLVEKLPSMHLAVPAAVAYLFYIQRSMTHEGGWTRHGCCQPFIARSWIGGHSRYRWWPSPRTCPILFIANPPIYGFATRQALGWGAFGSNQIKRVTTWSGGSPGHQTSSQI